MPLNLGYRSHTRLPFIKYDAKSGRWKVREGQTEVEIRDMIAVADFPNIATGWLYFPQGSAPLWVPNPSLSERLPQPTDPLPPDEKGVRRQFKEGFKLTLVLTKSAGQHAGPHEWSAKAVAAMTAIGRIYTAWEAEAANHPGQLPVIRCTQVIPVSGYFGTTYQPDFQIVGWQPASVVQTQPTPPGINVPTSHAPAYGPWGATNVATTNSQGHSLDHGVQQGSLSTMVASSSVPTTEF